MEALSGRGWFDAAVRDAHYSARKAFFLPSVCISGAAALIDDAIEDEKFPLLSREDKNQFSPASLRIILNNISSYPFTRY